eukprot:410062_1
MDHRKFAFKICILSTIIPISSTSDDYCATGFSYWKYNGMYVSVDEPVYSQQYNDMYSSDYVEIDEPVYYGLSSHRYMYRYYCDAYTCQGYSWRFGQNTRGVTPELICDSSSTYPPSSCEWYIPGSDNTPQSVHINPGECISTTEKPIEVSNCTIVYDDMNDPVSTEWIFNDTYGSVISTADHSGSCADFPCTALEGNYPMMTKVFRNISSHLLTSVQIIYSVACYVSGSTRGYLVQYKWGIDANWMQWDMDPEETSANYLHNLEDPPAGNVPLYIRFKYKWMGAPALYIDNFYLKATTSSCPEEKSISPTSTKISLTSETSPKSTKISLTSETVVIAGAVLLIVICCCVICFCFKTKMKESKDVSTESGRTRNLQPQINTADNEKVEGDDNKIDLEVNTADNEEAEGDDIRTVVTHQ